MWPLPLLSLRNRSFVNFSLHSVPLWHLPARVSQIWRSSRHLGNILSIAAVSAINRIFISESRVCSTSLTSLDSILCGGFHRGHITELVGDSAAGDYFGGAASHSQFLHAGKTQLLLQVAANCCVSYSRSSSDCLVMHR